MMMQSFLTGKFLASLTTIRQRDKNGMPVPHLIAVFFIISFAGGNALAEFRSIDGSGNNTSNPDYGSAGTQLLRSVNPDYSDGISSLAGDLRLGARAISNIVSAQSESIPNTMEASDFVWQWGQFLDHDIDLTEAADPAEPAPIPVPAGDPQFDPTSTGTQAILFLRSVFDVLTGSSNPRQQLNQITSFIDASNVYGSDQVRADTLRTLDGTGKLQTTVGGRYRH